MQPADWSSTYNSQFQDRRKYAAPYPGTSDPSFGVRTQAYYGTRAALAEHAARAAEASARTNGGYDAAVGGFGSSRSQNSWEGAFTMRSAGGLSSRSALGATYPPQSARAYDGGRVQLPTLAGTYNYGYRNKDLWNTPVERHTGIYSNYSTIRGGVNPQSVPARADGLVGISDYYVDQDGNSNIQSVSSNNWESYSNEYQPRAPQSFRKTKESKVWDNYHIPGYQGFVRGSQFAHGDTFGKTTRLCLSNPTDVPLEP